MPKRILLYHSSPNPSPDPDPPKKFPKHPQRYTKGGKFRYARSPLEIGQISSLEDSAPSQLPRVAMQKQQASPKGDGKSPSPSPSTQSPGESFSLVAFLQGTKEELGKVVWPTRQQLISESAAVLLMVSLSALLIYLVDNLFIWAASRVFG